MAVDPLDSTIGWEALDAGFGSSGPSAERPFVDPEAEIRRLPFWRGPVTTEPLAGGLTNVNFKVCDAQGTFAARAGEDDPRLGIDRRSELLCARLAARLGLAPAVVFAEPPWMVTTFVAGQTLDAAALQDHARLRRVASLLRTLHDAHREVSGHLPWFSPFLVARTYLDMAVAHDYAMPFAAAAVRRAVDDLEARLAPFRPALCHNDLMPGNLIEAEDRLWLIDWEYAGIGHPLFDVAGLASNAGLDAAATTALLDAYLDGSGLDPAQARVQLQILLPMAALRECLWAVVQGAGATIDFDYAAYRDDNFARFQRALTSLRADRERSDG